MKRLLAYLFIVLVLGLTFNVNANAGTKISGQCVEGDCKNSVGKFIDKVGYMLTGRFINNKFVGGKKEVTVGKYKGSVYVGKFVGNGNLVHGYAKISQKLSTGKNNVHYMYVSNARTIYPKSKDNFKKEINNLLKELYTIHNNKTKYACLIRGTIVKENFVVKHVDILTSIALYNCEYKVYPADKIYNRFTTFEFITENDLKKIISPIKKTQIVKTEPNQTQTNNDLEKERQKIAEEKKKIEEEKRKIAEAKKKQEEEDQKRKEANAKLYVIGSGTGFFVSSEGHVVSNDHVVGICRKVATKIEGKIINFNVIDTDKVNDLGLIQGEYKSKNFLNIKSGGAEFGEDIVTFGYPLSDDLSDSVKLTRGIVSSLSGPGNNYSEIQIDAAIQPGNSGGPVLNMEGQVVGVASSGLNKITKLLDENSPYIP
jgi:S1-C subfamily serine protease